MLYTVHDVTTTIRPYCVFDPDLNLVSRWKPYVHETTLADSYSISGMWPRIHGLSHDGLIEYFAKHTRFKLINIPSVNTAYEYW